MAKINVLVVDDEKDLCSLVKENLERTGRFSVKTVCESSMVIPCCEESAPDLVLLDVVMPGVQGSEIAKNLKSGSFTKNIPVIIMSGLGEMVYIRKNNEWRWIPNNDVIKHREEVIEDIDPRSAARAYGVDDYISKPFTTETLVTVIDSVLNKVKRA